MTVRTNCASLSPGRSIAAEIVSSGRAAGSLNLLTGRRGDGGQAAQLGSGPA
jgi:hypothetical protein